MTNHLCALLLHLVSLHSQDGFRFVTPGAGLVCKSDQYIGAAGAYENSIGALSAYAVGGIEVPVWRSINAGSVAGLVTGYGKSVRPIAALTASIPIAGKRMRLIGVPKTKVTPWTLSIAAEFD